MTATELSDVISGIAPVIRDLQVQIATVRMEWATDRQASLDLIAGLEQRLAAAEARPALPGPPGPEGPRGPAGLAGKDGAPGATGTHGRDGLPGVPGATGLAGRDGKDGADGLQGKDGHDGLNGKDGADGLGFEDLNCVIDEQKGVLLQFIRGDRKKEFALPCPMYVKPPWDPARKYFRGAVTTQDGSSFIADKTPPVGARPGQSPEWVLSNKRGREGKPGKDGKDGGES